MFNLLDYCLDSLMMAFGSGPQPDLELDTDLMWSNA